MLNITPVLYLKHSGISQHGYGGWLRRIRFLVKHNIYVRYLLFMKEHHIVGNKSLMRYYGDIILNISSL